MFLKLGNKANAIYIRADAIIGLSNSRVVLDGGYVHDLEKGEAALIAEALTASSPKEMATGFMKHQVTIIKPSES